MKLTRTEFPRAMHYARALEAALNLLPGSKHAVGLLQEIGDTLSDKCTEITAQREHIQYLQNLLIDSESRESQLQTEFAEREAQLPELIRLAVNAFPRNPHPEPTIISDDAAQQLIKSWLGHDIPESETAVDDQPTCNNGQVCNCEHALDSTHTEGRHDA